MHPSPKHYLMCCKEKHNLYLQLQTDYSNSLLSHDKQSFVMV